MLWIDAIKNTVAYDQHLNLKPMQWLKVAFWLSLCTLEKTLKSSAVKSCLPNVFSMYPGKNPPNISHTFELENRCLLNSLAV